MLNARMRPLIRLGLAALAAASPAVAGLPECPPISGTEGLFRAGTILLLGEQHGTQQSPAFTRDLACHALAAGLPLVVGLEISDSEQARFDAFVVSSGDAASRAALLAGGPWQPAQQYGVTSEAMLDLLEGLRKLRQGGGAVRIVLFNRRPDPDGKARDRDMARYLASALDGSDDAFTLVLTGNLHSRVVRGTRWSPDYEPMGYVLRKAVAPRRVVSLDVAHGGGTAWLCLSSEPCGAQQLKSRGPAGARGIHWTDSPAQTGHHGWYQVGDLTASPPACLAKPGEPPAATAELLWQHATGG